MSKFCGFTLIEVVIALLISSIIIVAISTALYRIIDSQKVLKKNSDEFKSLQLGLASIASDLNHAIERSSFDGVGQRPAFWGDNNQMSFSAFGPIAPVVFKYKLQEGSLLRATLPYLDVKKAEINYHTLIPHVEPIELIAFLRYLGADGLFYDAWPPPATVFASALPRAVQASFSVPGRGVITQLFLLPNAQEVSGGM